jgi:CheY-like chemotaxis protein
METNDAAPRRVLVVDDDATVREAVALVLESAGHVAERAGGGRQALAALAAGRFDAVVTDLYMPELDGLELIRAARRVLPNLRLIAMSGSTAGFDYLRAACVFGADAALRKPFTPERLLAALVPAVAREVVAAA